MHFKVQGDTSPLALVVPGEGFEMLRLVETEAECPDEAEDEEREPGGEPQRATDAQIKRLAMQLMLQIPADPEEAAEVLKHLHFLIKWRDGMAAKIAQAKAADAAGAQLLMLLSCAADEGRLADHGFRNQSSNYAASVLRRGFLGDSFALA
jgi:hypothetical protein